MLNFCDLVFRSVLNMYGSLACVFHIGYYNWIANICAIFVDFFIRTNVSSKLNYVLFSAKKYFSALGESKLKLREKICKIR